MKTLFSVLLVSICSMAFGQKKEAPTFKFDALNAAIVKEREQALKSFQKADSAMQEIARRMLFVNHIELADVSDSTRITPEGIFLKLRAKKK